ncbi:hypothetical protein BH11VER1_BH11VER1_25160 [soil metagenome]
MKLLHCIAPLLALYVSSTLAADPLARSGWKLAWADEFEIPGAPDPSKWGYEVGMIRNSELQFYTKDRRENARIEGGSLIIEARKERFVDPANPKTVAEYTSGSIQTRGLADWLYGRIEVRAKLPVGRGIWSGIWMMPTDQRTRWPGSGEIDIVENVGWEGDFVHASIHTGAYNHLTNTQKTAKVAASKIGDKFHVYTCEWDEKDIVFYVDNVRCMTYKNDRKGTFETWPFDKPFYLKLNAAVGGSWAGRKGVDDAAFPQALEVDYVRVYQPSKP